MSIDNFGDFTAALLETGFSMGGPNGEGVFTLCSKFGESVRWHTEDPETDPWEWRMRVLDESDDIAYAKVFFNKSGFITREWYPYFLAARRRGKRFEEAYADGEISHFAKRIYEMLVDNESLPFPALKRFGGFDKEDAARFEKALVELQMKLYITMCGRERKRSRYGEEYGWNATVFCRAEQFFDPEVFERAQGITPQQAQNAITAQIYKLNPQADARKIHKFIFG